MREKHISNECYVEFSENGYMVQTYSIAPVAVLTHGTVYNEPKGTYIKNNAFDGCDGLQKAELNPFVEVIGICAFKSCVNLTEIKLSKALKRIEAYAFENCKALKLIVIPKSVEYIDSTAFIYCDNINIIRED